MLGHRIIVAVTGASGAIYARQMLETLAATPSVERIALIVSPNGQAVAGYEGQALPVHEKIARYDFTDMFAPPASGSARWDAMAVVPCSMGTAGRIANGISDSLITRAADVMLKERRRLVLVAREAPLSTIHLRNLLTLSECGAVVVPASPSFYSRPCDLKQAAMTVTLRAIEMLGVEIPHYEWGKGK